MNLYGTQHTQNRFYYKADGKSSSNIIIIQLLYNCPNVIRINFHRRAQCMIVTANLFERSVQLLEIIT